MENPVAVIQEAVNAADRGDVTGLLDRFAEGALIRFEPPLPPPFRAAYQGKDGLREYFELLVTHGFHVDSGEYFAQGNEVTWHSQVSADLFRRLGVDKATATSRAYVQGGHILSIVIHYDDESVRKMESTLESSKVQA